ncbi:MAG: ABC transporter substrate-binding protein, partial [bacterium]|nr:ABC transporter substrate-binding protein [bacterium]
YTFHRNLAMGEFSETEPTPGVLAWDGFDTMPIESITATDKWTVVFELTQPDPRALRGIISPVVHYIIAREVIEEYGDMKDWRNVVGTGPWMLTDLVEGSSLTLTKNPNYWGYDEKYPGNRLPYVDELSVKVMPDPATRIAALRTGQIDYAGAVLNHPPTLNSIDKVESLKRTNPEIAIFEHYVRTDSNFGMNTQRAPFDDIRVRKAMQMALDLETLHDTYFKGWGTWGPQGLIANDVPVAGTPFEEWPEEVKKGYMYDPAGAEKLLDEAGYPRGADGIRFKAHLVWFDQQDLSHIELLAATYYREIGVDIEIEPVPGPELTPRKKARDWDMMLAIMADTGSWLPWNAMAQYKTGATGNSANVNDPTYDAMLAAAEEVSTEEEQLLLVKELNMYAIERHWTVFAGTVIPWTSVTQPWVKGYNGELKLASREFEYTIAARLWIDQELKESMGF